MARRQLCRSPFSAASTESLGSTREALCPGQRKSHPTPSTTFVIARGSKTIYLPVRGPRFFCIPKKGLICCGDLPFLTTYNSSKPSRGPPPQALHHARRNFLLCHHRRCCCLITTSFFGLIQLTFYQPSRRQLRAVAPLQPKRLPVSAPGFPSCSRSCFGAVVANKPSDQPTGLTALIHPLSSGHTLPQRQLSRAVLNAVLHQSGQPHTHSITSAPGPQRTTIDRTSIPPKSTSTQQGRQENLFCSRHIICHRPIPPACWFIKPAIFAIPGRPKLGLKYGFSPSEPSVKT